MKSRKRWTLLIVGLLWGVIGGAGLSHAEWAELSPATTDGLETYRLNCGADTFNFTDGAHQWWTKDEPFDSLYRWGYVGGHLAGATTADILGTTEDAIYQTNRFGGAGGEEFRYRLEMPNGHYRVTLHFAETYWNGPGQRRFDVALENKTVEYGLDIFSRAGGKFRALALTYETDVADEALDVTFPNVAVDNALICGIEAVALTVSDDQFLNFVQHKLFWAFWNETDPLTGLISDRVPNWTNTPGGAASIASTGYGLSVLTIADQRGWMPRNQIIQRIKNTLATFAGSAYAQPGQTMFLPHLQGFFYHWIDRSTGSRAWSSEVSTVDTGLFALGALQAAEYFRGIDDSIAGMADYIYRRMNWTWWQNRVPTGWDPLIGDFITMGWVPEVRSGKDDPYYPAPTDIGGSFTKARWDAYSEAVLVNLLAMGSPTHAVSTAPWVYMARPWAEQYGHSYMHLAPLFAHQYHNLYYDFRNRHDAFVDYAETLRRATLVNKNYCQTIPGYADKRWGLTSADNPVTEQYKTDYGVPPGGSGDGTVAPTAALASIPFTPTESIAAARHMYFQYKHDIWGRYGFTDSFNVSAHARSKDLITLDNGPIIMAIENYRTGMVRDTFMRSSYAQMGMNRAGFTGYDGKPYYFASTVKNRNLASLAFDGNTSTRWESEWSDPQWIAVDYITPHTVNRLRLKWETAYGSRYQVESSNDGNQWTPITDVISSDGGDDVVSFPSKTARFFRLKGLQRGVVGGNSWGYSLWECAFENESQPTLSTFLGGSGRSSIAGVVTDTAGNIYVAGSAGSDHPTTSGAYDTSYNGGVSDAFVAKFGPDGRLIYSTWLGGSAEDSAAALTVDGNGAVYVTGLTYSTNFPTTLGALDQTLGGERDAFVAKINPAGNALSYATYLGGPSWDYGQKIALGSGGQVFVAGFTHGDFPTTVGAVQTTFGGMGDAYVVRLDAGGKKMLYSTYLGGSSWDGPGGIAVDTGGNAYVVGNTHSPNFPTTAGAWDRTCSNCSTNQSTDGFAVKISSGGNRLIYSTFVGGAANPASESLDGISLDSSGRVVAVGMTNGADFPVTTGALQKTKSNGFDAVVVKISTDGARLLYSTYLGGSGDERAYGARLESDGRIVLAGLTGSTNFPVTSRAAQAVNAGGNDAFLAEIAPAGTLDYATYWGGSGNEGDAISLTRDSAGKNYLVGGTASPDFPTSATAQQKNYGGGEQDGFLTVFPKVAIGTGLGSPILAVESADLFQWGEVYWYPNPAKKATPVLHVEIGEVDQVDARLYDVTGRLVREFSFDGPPVLIDDGQGPQPALEQPLDVSELASGVYSCLIRARKAGRDDLQTKAKLAVVR